MLRTKSQEKPTNLGIGRSGEKIAARYLRSIGYTVTKTNVTTPCGEMDIVARDGAYTVFCEVKTIMSEDFGSPLFNITNVKKRTMIRNALFYMRAKRIYESPCRIDVVAITLDEKGRMKMIEHVKNAVEIENENYF